MRILLLMAALLATALIVLPEPSKRLPHSVITGEPARLVIAEPLFLQLELGKTHRATVTAYNSQGDEMSDLEIVWLPTDQMRDVVPSCVRIDSAGLLTAIAPGRCGVNVLALTSDGTLRSAEDAILVTVIDPDGKPIPKPTRPRPKRAPTPELFP